MQTVRQTEHGSGNRTVHVRFYELLISEELKSYNYQVISNDFLWHDICFAVSGGKNFLYCNNQLEHGYYRHLRLTGEILKARLILD